MAAFGKYQITVPEKNLWIDYANKLQDKITSGCDEPELQKYLKDHPWILLAVFGSDAEGFVFTEYSIDDGEDSDFVVVTGRSYPDVLLIEIKSPKANLFVKSGRMSQHFNEGLMQSLNRLFMLMNDDERHQKRFRRQTAELVSAACEHYQGRWAGPVTSNFTIPFPSSKPCRWQAKIIIGTDPKSERDNIFRSQFMNHFQIEIMHWDRVIRQLGRYAELRNPEER